MRFIIAIILLTSVVAQEELETTSEPAVLTTTTQEPSDIVKNFKIRLPDYGAELEANSTEVLTLSGEDTADNEQFNIKKEQGRHFQGDIKLPPALQKKMLSNETIVKDDATARTGMTDLDARWPMNKKGQVVVPYEFKNKHEYTLANRNLIKKAMSGIMKKTCIVFTPRKNHKNYLLIEDGNECSSYLGKVGGMQEVTLDSDGCMAVGTIQHELIHSLGYTHMHNHENRDDFVTINWQNIEDEQKHNFKKVNPAFYDNFGTEYDYRSVMHYDSNTFSRNEKDTIVPKDASMKDVIGTRDNLSKGDAKRINNMYKCKVKL